jgi:hypothetical protein
MVERKLVGSGHTISQIRYFGTWRAAKAERSFRPSHPFSFSPEAGHKTFIPEVRSLSWQERIMLILKDTETPRRI